MINNPERLQQFLHSGSCKKLVEFIVELQQSVVSKKISDTPKLGIFSVFDEYFASVQKDLDDSPPVEGKNRFGNIAFKTFYDKVNISNEQFLMKMLKSFNLESDFAIDLREYLKEAYGDRSRVDYGTGHELNFMIFLFCLNAIKSFEKQHLQIGRAHV